MASVVLKSVGSAVGNMFLPGIGGALLGGFAGNLGGVIDGRLGLGGSALQDPGWKICRCRIPAMGWGYPWFTAMRGLRGMLSGLRI